MKRNFIAKLTPLVLALGVSVVSVELTPQWAVGAELAGGMAKLDYLLGTAWVCSETPSGAPESRLAFDVAVQNGLHEHGLSRDAESDSYVTYSPTTNRYYLVTASNGGFYAFLTSPDGIHFSGTGRAGVARVFSETITYNRLSATQMKIEQETLEDGIHNHSQAFCHKDATY